LLDISSKPQIELLSEREKELCATLRLLPEQYIIIKETLLREYMKHGELKKSQARQMIKIGMRHVHSLAFVVLIC
jgi:transcriptional adapter 2-alpha